MKVKVEVELLDDDNISEQRENMYSAVETLTNDKKSITLITKKTHHIVAEFTMTQMPETKASDVIATELTDYLGEYEEMIISFLKEE